MLGYVIIFIVCLICIIVGTYFLIKYPFKMTRLQDIILGISLLFGLIIIIIETITCYTFPAQEQYLFIYYNITPLILLIAIITCFLTGNIKQFSRCLLALLTIPTFIGMVLSSIYYIKNSLILL